MKYKTPNVEMKIPSMESVMNDVVQYFNEILEYYGPPCEYCSHFDDEICAKSYRPRVYWLELGPFEKWHLRKFCEDMEFEEDEEDEIDKIMKKVRHSLDCFAQKYC